MGFDLYGINPVVRKGKIPVKPEGLYEGKEVDKKTIDKYYNKRWEFEENNPGSYFRNNCWWWRGLWDYTYSECGDILTKKDWETGHYNDAHEITEEKASAIGKRLKELIDDGSAKKYCDLYELNRKEAEENNKDKKCGSKGYDWAESYPLYLENIQDYATFCSESGGFEIC